MSNLTVIHAVNGSEALYAGVRALFDYGYETSPRDMRTLELAPVAFVIGNPADPFPLDVSRAKLLPAIGVAEGLQNVAGMSCPGLMSRIAAFFPKPTHRWDAGIPTYGERLQDGDQLAAVARLLQRDPDSRQAVATIWRPYDVELGQAHNLCTTSLQWLLRGDRLNMAVTMRSNDAWWGACYDWPQFAIVQQTLANVLDADVGTYFHHAASFHLYERHWDAAQSLTPPPEWPLSAETCRSLKGVGKHGDSWYTVRHRARMLLAGQTLEDATPTEAWFAEQLAPYDPKGD